MQTPSSALSQPTPPANLRWSKRLQCHLALSNALTIWVAFALLSFTNETSGTNDDHFIAYGTIIALLVGILTFWAIQRVLKPLHAIAGFIYSLPTYPSALFSSPSALPELNELTEALNRTATKLHAHDMALNRAFNELQEQQYAFDHHAIVSFIDFNGYVQYANDLLCDMTGYVRHELLGQPWTLLMPEQDTSENHTALWDQLLKGQIWRGEISVKPKQGSMRWLESTLVPIRDLSGKPHHIICIQTDITTHKNNEQGLAANQKALEMMAANMEQLIKERTAELEVTNNELVHANQVKSEFISIVSHELRTPLTSIKSFADILNDELTDPDSKNYLRIINEEADRLNRLINDILDMQKIDAGRMVWRDERINLIDVTRAAVESFSGAYQAKNIALVLDVSDAALYTVTDSDKIRQVLANLLSNALKFTQQGKVVVSIRLVGDHDGKAFIQTAVRDNGPGLAASQLERVFEQFYQVENDQSRKIQGTGLGLTICKQIVEHYQGKIWAESELGKGATMLFMLPSAQANTQAGVN